MGCVGSSERKSESNGVDEYLESERIKNLTSFKVLLLGAGESGKSTVVKQLKSIHRVELDDQELNNYKVTIHNNTLSMMQIFIEHAEKFGYEFSEQEQKAATAVKSFTFDTENKLMSPEIGQYIAQLWTSEAIKKTYERRNEFWNLDSSDYYFTNVERFCEDGYKPTEEDCIMARVRTTGIVVTEFVEGPVRFSVVDVAGQRSERKKWIHCFDDVKCLVFVVSLAGFNQVMFEDANHNRMHEALNLFQQIANNPVFLKTPIFLFLNKKDLFEKMIQETDLSKCFPEYSGGKDLGAALDFIKQEFEKRMEDSNKNRLHVQYIAARFKKDVKYSWDELTAILLEENKKDVREAAKKTKKAEKAKK